MCGWPAEQVGSSNELKGMLNESHNIKWMAAEPDGTQNKR